MDPLVAQSANLYQLGNHLFPRALEGLQTDQLFKTPGDSNPMIWLAGHLTYCRCSLVNLIGFKRDRPWEKLFGRYSKIAAPSDYPAIGEIQSIWDEVAGELPERFQELSDERLSAKAPYDFPTRDKSLRGAIAFMAFHEAYHVGQMAYLRKWLGYGGLIDG